MQIKKGGNVCGLKKRTTPVKTLQPEGPFSEKKDSLKKTTIIGSSLKAQKKLSTHPTRLLVSFCERRSFQREII